MRGSVKEAMRRSILFICVMVIGGLWMSNAGYYMKVLNALSVEAQGKLLTAGMDWLALFKMKAILQTVQRLKKEKKWKAQLRLCVIFTLTLL